MLTLLLVLTVCSAIPILPCRVEHGENVEEKGLENNAKNTPNEEIQIDIPNPVSLCVRSPCVTRQVMDTNTSLNGLSGILMDEKVVSNNNSTSTDQTEIDTRETAILLHKTPNESQDSAANNFQTGLIRESMEEVH
ncbi:hypothetical protein HHK36_023290 [Tetracentron sinense]|uniref:Uncharacterized protein n=1 Tax=Tetracentron sinense TaxID=13715 RepID=A0A834YPY8_TETSI|nr:hypothetical protein HHK36_023290 [Tetracentron sinense]